MNDQIPNRARAVIVGGGVVGCSVAYHLTKLGWREIVLIERKRLTSGTTWHAAGLVGQLRTTLNMTRLAQYTATLYAGLEAETGQATGWRRCGSVSLATTKERLVELRRGAAMARAFGLDAHEVDAAEIARLWPLLAVSDVEGGIHLPGDGQTNPVDTTLALAAGARAGGARIIENVAAGDLLIERGRAVGVRTEAGEIRAEVVVLATGMWSREFGARHGVALPLQACEHVYVVTEPFPGLAPGTPVLRDPDHCAYFKEDAGKLLIGAFEPQARPWAVDGIPEGFEFGELAGDFDRFLPILEAAMARVPALREVGLRQFFTGPESFTPDVRYMLGETAEVAGLFVACGFNSTGIQSAGGAGKALAEWIVGGAAPMDLSDVDVRRFQPFQAIPAYVAARAAESLGLLYAMHWPGRQAETARGVRVSPFHERLAVRGACFGEVAGWERVEWFAPAGTDPAPSYSYGRAAWFPYAAAEHRAAHEGCALFDLTAGGRFLVQGEGALALLEAMSTAALDVPAGTLVSTLWLDDRGGIEADVAVLRLAERSFLVLGAAATARRDLALLEAAAQGVAHAVVSEVSGGYAALGLAGPRTGPLLASLGVAVAVAGTARDAALGMARVRVLGGGPTGTAGCTILVPTEFGAGVLDTLFAAGEGFGLVPGGAQALESLRVEAGGRRWGREMTIETRPGEVGLAGRVAMAKPGGFRGRAALEAPPRWPARRLLWFRLEDPAPLLFQDEPVWREGQIVGRITSGAYGHMTGAAVGLGLVAAEHAAAPEAGRFEIEIAGRRLAARARGC